MEFDTIRHEVEVRTVRAIWESRDRPYRAAMEQGLPYTRLGDPLGTAGVAELPHERREPRPR